MLNVRSRRCKLTHFLATDLRGDEISDKFIDMKTLILIASLRATFVGAQVLDSVIPAIADFEPKQPSDVTAPNPNLTIANSQQCNILNSWIPAISGDCCQHEKFIRCHPNGSIWSMYEPANLSIVTNQNLNGPVPRSLTFPDLQILNLANNGLNGGLPSFSGMPKIRQLWLANNNLSGIIPPDFSTAIRLSILQVFLIIP